jgi:glycosyltransferase involved in cell wall biosynthesis
VKALLLSHSDGGGGAGRAARRLLDALNASGIDSRMHVDFLNIPDSRVTRNSSPFADLARRTRITLGEIPAFAARHPHPELFSPGFGSAISARRLKASTADILNAHWTGYGYLSIRQLAKIDKPLVWTMHDMWAFTGGCYYDDEGPDARWRAEYTKANRVDDGTRFDVERWVADRKKRHWRKPRHAITPSAWLAELARSSDLLGNWSVHVIPNALDTDAFRPIPSDEARALLGLPMDRSIVLVALSGDLSDPRKGFDLLQSAIRQLTTDNEHALNFDLAVIGRGEPPAEWPADFPTTHWLGYLNDTQLPSAYSAADAVIVPSRQDNLPQTGTEAQACGTPVVAFAIGGLPDIVSHKETGYLAVPTDPQDLAAGIAWVLLDEARRSNLAVAARERAVRLWSAPVVAAAHAELFGTIIDEHHSHHGT